MLSWKKKMRAFTLIECLVALIILSGSLLVVEGLTRLLAQDLAYSSQLPMPEWQLFCGQLERELADCSLQRIEDNFLYVKKGDQELRFGQPVGAKDFRKSHARGTGYQPLLFGLSKSRIFEKDDIIHFELEFEGGRSLTYLYRFSGEEL